MPLLPKSVTRRSVRELFGTPGVVEVVAVAVVVIAAEVVAIGIITGVFSSHGGDEQTRLAKAQHHARPRHAAGAAAVTIVHHAPGSVTQPDPAPVQTQAQSPSQPAPEPVSDPAPTLHSRRPGGQLRHHHHFGGSDQPGPAPAPDVSPGHPNNQDEDGQNEHHADRGGQGDDGHQGPGGGGDHGGGGDQDGRGPGGRDG